MPRTVLSGLSVSLKTRLMSGDRILLSARQQAQVGPVFLRFQCGCESHVDVKMSVLICRSGGEL